MTTAEKMGQKMTSNFEEDSLGGGELPSPAAFRVMSFGFGNLISRSEWDELRKLTQTLFHVEQFHSIFSPNPLLPRFNISASSRFF